ncbi:MAG: hydroxyethylthiazole kinase [Alphaproteobacteria bacterium]
MNLQNIIDATGQISQKNPLVLSLTNHVVMNSTANALLAIGASPIMSMEQSETAELVAISNAVVLNIGTLNEYFIAHAYMAAKYGKKYHKPVILDPVGVGASQIRMEAALKILSTDAVTIIKGNASEIIALAGSATKSKGVDSLHDTGDALDAAKKLAKEYNVCVGISGATDIIVNSQYIAEIALDVPIMQKVTGTGCTAAAICGAYAGVEPDSFTATLSALAIMSAIGNKASQQAAGPASFWVGFLDCLSHISADDLSDIPNIHVQQYEV